jgi:hypothetical protein
MIRLLSPSAVGCVAAVLLATAAQGQQAPAGAAPPARTAAPAAPAPSPAHLALARELITINGLSRLVDPFMPQFSAQVRRGAVTRPELTKDLDQVLESLKPEVDQQKQSMVETTARYYASTFTEAEIKDLIAFFKTPTGQKYLQLSPKILDGLAVEAQRWAERTSEQVMSRVRAEMAKRGHQM